MAAPDIVSELPVELAQRIFGFFTYLELLPVLATCRTWRQIAIDCPVYWSGTMLSAPTEGEANTMAVRLRRANGRPCIVHTHTPRRCDTLTNTIIPALSANIHSISWLNIYVHVSQCEEVFSLLRLPDWQLHALELSFSVDSGDAPLPTLPRDLLHEHAPRLRMLWLENIVVEAPYPAVFASVVAVGFGYFPPETMIRKAPNLWSYFPKMRMLTLAGDTELGDAMIADARWSQLDWLRLQISDTALQRVFEHTPAQLSLVPNVQIPCARADLADRLLQHIPGPLHVALQIPPDADANVRVHLGDAAWDRSRGLATDLEDWLEDDAAPCDVFSRAAVAARLVSLTLPDVVWHAATRDMLPLRTLAELRLVFDLNVGVGLAQLCEIGKALCCPALRRLILRVEQGEYYVTLEQVRSFALAALDGWRAPLEVQLEGVTLRGYGRALPDDEMLTFCWKAKEHFQ
ncbi:hypothetical protein AURDEDRAFT_164524 [Auricularia subglabra TFB-10046 SS5]|nr:hypothetical protein AURDEDRAFT_164524 [Auricularia subglabra TFB-10046 SS5]